MELLFMKEIGKIMKRMDKENYIKMLLYLKAFGKKIINMAKEFY